MNGVRELRHIPADDVSTVMAAAVWSKKNRHRGIKVRIVG